MAESSNAPHILLVPMGTPGDLQPFIDLGVELRGRGRRVSLLAHANFEPWATSAGLEFVAIGSAEEYDRFLSDKNLWKLANASRVFAKKLACPAIEPTYRAIARAHGESPIVVVAQTMALGARIARDRLDFRLITLHRQPAVLRSICNSARIPVACLPDWMPRPLKRAQFWLIDQALDHTYLPAINGKRAEIGLAPVKRFADRWLQSPDGAICFWPQWFAPIQPDWPQGGGGTKLVGFNLQQRAEREAEEALKVFLAAGGAPVVFTIGSGMRQQGAKFYGAAIDICRMLGRRGVLVTKSMEGVRQPLPESVHHAEYAPFRWLLPRCSAVVHHAGIGTVGEALAAGIPQLSMSGLVFDTMDTARRLERLGVGATVPAKKFTPARAADALRRLLDDSAIKTRCRDVAGWVKDDAVAAAADIVDEM